MPLGKRRPLRRLQLFLRDPLPNDEVDEPVGDHDLAPDLFPVDRGLHLGRCFRPGGDICVGLPRRYLQRVAELAVDLHGDRDRFAGQERLVNVRPWRHPHAFAAQRLPQFARRVGREDEQE